MFRRQPQFEISSCIVLTSLLKNPGGNVYSIFLSFGLKYLTNTVDVFMSRLTIDTFALGSLACCSQCYDAYLFGRETGEVVWSSHILSNVPIYYRQNAITLITSNLISPIIVRNKDKESAWDWEYFLHKFLPHSHKPTHFRMEQIFCSIPCVDNSGIYVSSLPVF